VLADLAVNDPATFAALVQSARAHAPAEGTSDGGDASKTSDTVDAA
jgi:hypothetical protein